MDILDVTMPGETWKPVVGWEGLYSVSDHGRVWSHRDTLVMRPQHNATGHQYVFMLRDGRRKKTYIHRLVLSMFVSEPPHASQACHGDGNPTNNHVSNLRWGSAADNQRDTTQHNRRKVLGMHPMARLTLDDARSIRAMYAAWGTSHEKMAAIYGVHRTAISAICRGETWQEPGTAT